MGRERLCIINVVGLTPSLVKHAPTIQRLGDVKAWRSPLPAVTATSQATMLTGLEPRDHGIVGNGWFYRDTQEIRFWQQANSLVQGKKFYEGIETAKMFWWFNQSAPVRWSATPKPHYGSDGSKVFDILDRTECDLQTELGAFPFFTFWGPNAGLPCSNWIAQATARVIEKNSPELTLVYLPHLDYDYQRFSSQDPNRVREVDECVKVIVEMAEQHHTRVIVVSEYGLVPVERVVYPNRILRNAGLLSVRAGPFGEMLLPGESEAFAVVDHQLAHIYVMNSSRLAETKRMLEDDPGVDAVVEPGELGLDHPRSGELIALAKPDSWFAYYYWLDDRNAPDFATSVDIHRKPGYDPCELFMTSKMRAIARVAQKKLGMRYRMDIVPLNAELVKGSHGLRNEPEHGPVIIGPAPPDDMKQFPDYVRELLNA